MRVWEWKQLDAINRTDEIHPFSQKSAILLQYESVSRRKFDINTIQQAQIWDSYEPNANNSQSQEGKGVLYVLK